jgi:hypothetical protein
MNEHSIGQIKILSSSKIQIGVLAVAEIIIATFVMPT